MKKKLISVLCFILFIVNAHSLMWNEDKDDVYLQLNEDKKKAEIKAMGMAACQTKCLRCGHCSANKCGNRS